LIKPKTESSELKIQIGIKTRNQFIFDFPSNFITIKEQKNDNKAHVAIDF